jgi:hypothetical protein
LLLEGSIAQSEYDTLRNALLRIDGVLEVAYFRITELDFTGKARRTELGLRVSSAKRDYVRGVAKDLLEDAGSEWCTVEMEVL